jgi:2-alkyl-3-oxoalkanoate reductase
MTVLVTGAGGFLGGHLVDLLLEQGEAVRILARPGEDATRLIQAGVEVCRGDLTNYESLETAVDGIDRVLHCAALCTCQFDYGTWG